MRIQRLCVMKLETLKILYQQMLLVLCQQNFIRKVRYKMDCYILNTVWLVIILLFIIAVICYHYAKHKAKQRNELFHEQYKKMENKKLVLKIVRE